MRRLRRSPIHTTHVSRRFLWSASCEHCPNWRLVDVTYRTYRAWSRMHMAAHNRRSAA